MQQERARSRSRARHPGAGEERERRLSARVPRRCRGLDLRGGRDESRVVPIGRRGEHGAGASDEERVGRRVRLIARWGRAGGVEEGDPGGRREERVCAGRVVGEVIPLLGVVVGAGRVGGGQGGVRRGVLEEVFDGEDQHEGAHRGGWAGERGDDGDGDGGDEEERAVEEEASHRGRRDPTPRCGVVQ